MPGLPGFFPEQVVNTQIIKAAKCGTPYAEYWPHAGDDAWITTMHPGVAAPLSMWLRGHADYIEGVQCSATPESMAFARSILGETEAA